MQQAPVTPDTSVTAAQSVAGYKGLMLAETVAHTDGQTLRILKYRQAAIALRAIVA